MFAQNLLGSIAKSLFSCFIEFYYLAIVVDGNNHVQGTIDDAPGPFLCCFQIGVHLESGNNVSVIQLLRIQETKCHRHNIPDRNGFVQVSICTEFEGLLDYVFR